MISQQIKTDNNFNIIEYNEYIDNELVLTENYDTYGNKTYINYHDGKWFKRQFHPNNNLAHLENHAGYVCEYNESGDPIFVLEGNGNWMVCVYIDDIRYSFNSSGYWYIITYTQNSFKVADKVIDYMDKYDDTGNKIR